MVVMMHGFRDVALMSCATVQDSVDGKAEVLLDPNTLSEDGTVALSIKRFSENAEFLAYGLSRSGSDWLTIKVMRVKDRVVLPDTLSWVRYCDLGPIHSMLCPRPRRSMTSCSVGDLPLAITELAFSN